MKTRHMLLAALAAFVFSAAAVAGPGGGCKQCRTEYQICQANGGEAGTRDCETPFSQCLIAAGCPLE
ncbi:hypothetical protein [Lysobacter enzymogenes]|jgi:hypothetical protein|uniref:Lipoprotein n=1 Tax=Lysobacter enzymogenes TaxID=69 RepID=A0AAU9ALP7_LYSEN|nr:hypothetical protein [Lysobacter enzymogenes]MBO7942472.1 hypothetical protein [Streptomyces sp. S9]BAV98224.1 conserved hypothetical protein [Lysobacter enzymogenes]SDX45829.1 hypothetical protein SAMN05421681_105297 [Lysobacter enzymogenes]